MLNKNKLLLFIIIIGLSFVISENIVYDFCKKNNKKLKDYSISETKHFMTDLIKDIIDSSYEKVDDDIIVINRNNYNEIEMIDFDVKRVNVILKNITYNIKNKLRLFEQGKIKELEIDNDLKERNYTKLYKGVLFLFDDDLFSQYMLFGNDTKIPVKISFVGNIYTSFITNIKNYGYNSSYLEVNILVELKEKISIPTGSFQYVIKNKYPIVLKIVQGSLPSYYSDKFSSSSNYYSLPLNK